MLFRQIRNATVLLEYAGKRLLIDPWLIPKAAGPAFQAMDPQMQAVHSPLVDLPMRAEELLQHIDAICVTHIHADHFEHASAQLLNKATKMFVQNEADFRQLTEWGFRDVEILLESGTVWNGIHLFKTRGRHGETPETAAGEVSGLVLKSAEEKTLYLAGDTIWYSEVAETIRRFAPEIIVLNCGDAYSQRYGRLIMNAEDVIQVCLQAPEAVVIASHMEAVNHARLTRQQLKTYVQKHHAAAKLLIPQDGETFEF